MKHIKTIHSLFVVVDIAFIIIISLLVYLSLNITSTSVVYVPKGNIKQIITYLDKRNFEISPQIDKYLLMFLGKPQAGWVDIKDTSLSKGDFLYRLTKAKAATKPLIIYPGETTEFVLKMLAHELDLDYIELRAAYDLQAKFEDGIIVPDTYNIPIGIQARHLISYLLGISQMYHQNLSEKIFRNYDKKRWLRYLIIASIIQKEAGNEEEMPLISSVIYNRLKKGMKLQMDGALNYGEYSHVRVTAKRISEDNTRFNTYKYAGLPPYPICLVNTSAIKAAIFPKKTNYLYFVKIRDGKNSGHVFSKTFNEHKQNTKHQSKIQKKLKK